MAILIMLLLWSVFAVALSLTVFSDLIPDRIETVITLIAAPVATALCSYLIYQLTRRYKPATQSTKDGKYIPSLWRFLLIFTAYLLALVLGTLFLFMQKLPNMAQMAFTLSLGILAIVTLFIMLDERYRYSDSPAASIEDWIFRSVWALFVIVIAGSFFSGRLANPVQAISIILFGSLTIYFTLLTAALLSSGHALSMESHWGGLGGGMGGWRLSRLMVFFILAIFFGGLTATLVTQANYAPSTNESAQAPSQQKEKSDTSNKAKPPETTTQSTDSDKTNDKKSDGKKD